MTIPIRKYVLAVLILLVSLPVLAQSPAANDFDTLVDQYFDFLFQYHPTFATAAGFHQYDAKLEDYSRSALDAETAGLKSMQEKVAAFPASQLSPDSAADLELIAGAIDARLLELEDIQMWRKDPSQNLNEMNYSVFLIMKRKFAPPEDRLRVLIARERQIPEGLAASRRDLSNPPKIYTDIALEQLPAIIGFFRKDVPEAFAEVKDPKLLAEFKASNAATVQALQRYQNFLKEDLLPISKGDFRIGTENFRKKLLYEEMVDVPLDHLLEIGYADLHRNQQRLKEAAAQIDPKHTPREVLAELQKDHPPAGQLLQSFRDVLVGLRQFIVQNKIVTIPSPIPPIVEETPPFARSLTTASMDTPGAFETKATEAIFNVTLPDPRWPPQKAEEWMESFNRPVIVAVAAHEAYPGHYVQFLWIKQAPSKTRKILFCSSNAEGWAHYSEQMMLDEGYGNGDPKLRLGQVDDALLRNARFIVGIEMHTGKMTEEQARKFFVDEGYQLPPVADEETKRGASDPTYLYYTLGKLQILKLREDYRKLQGDKFSLEEFHNRFMQQGAVPLKIIRKSMLGDDSPTL
jgi:uncharacterized protein (DUF885 family)